MLSLLRVGDLLLLVAAVASLVSASCGGGHSDADSGPQSDSAGTDAFLPVDTGGVVEDGGFQWYAGTVSIAHLQLTNSLSDYGIADGTMRGARVSVSYTDLTTASVVPTVGYGGVGECTVFVYDVDANAPAKQVNAGVVSISGAGIRPAAGLPACAFEPSLMGYSCGTTPTTLPTGASITHSVDGLLGLVTQIEVPSADFQALGAEGMMIRVSGLPSKATGEVSGATYTNNGSHMIVGIDPFGNGANRSKIQVVNLDLVTAPAGDITATQLQALTETVDQTGDAGPSTDGATFKVVAGSGPVPLITTHLGTTGVEPFEFISDYRQSIRASKTGNAILPDYSVTLQPSGQGLALSTSSARLHDFAAAATGNADVTFACDDGIDGDCGSDGADTSAGQVPSWLLSGSTTDAEVSADPTGFEMPDPVARYATFTCRGGPYAASISLTGAALDAIMSTNPTRIESRLVRVTTDLTNAAPTVFTSGNGFVGYNTLGP